MRELRPLAMIPKPLQCVLLIFILGPRAMRELPPCPCWLSPAIQIPILNLALRTVETEFVVGLSSLWSLNHYSVCSSYSFSWKNTAAWTIIAKLAIAVILAATYNTTVLGVRGDAIRDVALLAIMSAWAVALARPPACYRLWSTQIVAVVCVCTHVLTLAPRALLSLGFQSQVLYLLGLLLPAHHGAAALALMLVLAYSCFKCECWPVNWGRIRQQDAALLQELTETEAHVDSNRGWHGGMRAVGDGGEGSPRTDIMPGNGNNGRIHPVEPSLRLFFQLDRLAEAQGLGGEGGRGFEDDDEEEELVFVHKRLDIMRQMLVEVCCVCLCVCACVWLKQRGGGALARATRRLVQGIRLSHGAHICPRRLTPSSRRDFEMVSLSIIGPFHSALSRSTPHAYFSSPLPCRR